VHDPVDKCPTARQPDAENDAAAVAVVKRVTPSSLSDHEPMAPLNWKTTNVQTPVAAVMVMPAGLLYDVPSTVTFALPFTNCAVNAFIVVVVENCSRVCGAVVD
jgi:hypothetical protein